MKVLKYFSCIILIVTLIISVYSVNAESMEYTTKLELAKAVLGSDGLKIIEGIDENAQGITRAKMVEIMYKMLDLTEYVNSLDFVANDSFKVIYDDVDSTHWAYESIYVAQNYINLCGDGVSKFRPDDLCTYGEFYKTILNTTGWGMPHEALIDKSSFPYLYYNLGEKIGLSFKKNCYDDIIPIDDIYLYTYECITGNTMAIFGFGKQSLNIVENMLYRFHDTEIMTGKIEITDTQTIIIGDVKFCISDSCSKGLKDGYAVCFYTYDEETDKNNICTIANVSCELSEEIKNDIKKTEQAVGDTSLLLELYEYIQGYY